METKKGVKAFKKGLICRDYQFKENEIFETDEVKVCEKGFHYCENPLDVLDYYDLCDTEFAEVEDMGVTQVDGNKSATTKIKIGSKLGLKGFIKLAVDFIFDKVKITGIESGNYSQVATSGYYSQVATSGYNSQVAIEGKDSVAANIGIKGQIKGVIGTWITLAEYDSDNKILLVKSDKIDGKILKENTWYKLENNKFKEI